MTNARAYIDGSSTPTTKAPRLCGRWHLQGRHAPQPARNARSCRYISPFLPAALVLVKQEKMASLSLPDMQQRCENTDFSHCRASLLVTPTILTNMKRQSSCSL